MYCRHPVAIALLTMEDFQDNNGNNADGAAAVLNQWLNDNIGGTGRLYGRTEELERIFQVYERATAPRTPAAVVKAEQQRTEFIVIEGETGSGKSALAVRSLATQLSRNGGYSVLGKFDQLVQLQRPHSAFVDAFTRYAEEVTKRRDVERIRQAVRSSIENAKDVIEVLMNMVPALEKILLDPLPEELSCDKTENSVNNIVDISLSSPANIATSCCPGKFSPSGASSHSKHALRMFLRAVVSPEAPLILILDDCHWMDGAALDVLQFLLTDTMIRGLIVVGTCRSDCLEPFTTILRQLSPQVVNMTKIHLTKFKETAICSMLSDIFKADEMRVAPLANFISDQTHGNIFFILESLRTLIENNCIRHDTTADAWNWDMEKVQYDFTGSLLEVVRRKISHLQNETIEAPNTLHALEPRLIWKFWAIL